MNIGDSFDCGTDIDLFLEMAQMKTNGWENKWVIGDDIENGNFGKMWKTQIQPSPSQLLSIRKATPQEVYNYLKQK